MPDIVDLTKVAKAARARFEGRPIAFGQDDCGQMAAFVARGLGARARLIEQARFTTRKGARRWMDRRGFTHPGAVMDACGFERLAPARLLPCDFLALPSPEGDEIGCALVMWLGSGTALGWGAGRDYCDIMRPDIAAALTGWRLWHG